MNNDIPQPELEISTLWVPLERIEHIDLRPSKSKEVIKPWLNNDSSISFQTQGMR